MTATNFTEEKAKQDLLYIALNDADQAFQSLIKDAPRGPMGLLPDAVKLSPEFRHAKASYDHAFQAIRAFNGPFVKQFKKEIKADRFARRGY